MTTRTLLLMRHGKSDWNAREEDDFSRPLAKRGTRSSKLIGQWLAGQQLQPEAVIASPATRTLQTAKLVCKVLDIPQTRIVQNERLYLAEASTLLDVLRQLPADLRIALLVGHNPGLEELLASLPGNAIPDPENGKLMPTAALAQLEFDSDWTQLAPGQARLVELVRARSLDDR